MRDNLIDEVYIRCKRCGALELTEDFYAQSPKKYCRKCAAIVEKEKTLERVHRLREKAREKRKLQDDENKELRKQVLLLKEYNKNLEHIVSAQREQLEMLFNPDNTRYTRADRKEFERKKDF